MRWGSLAFEDYVDIGDELYQEIAALLPNFTILNRKTRSGAMASRIDFAARGEQRWVGFIEEFSKFRNLYRAPLLKLIVDIARPRSIKLENRENPPPPPKPSRLNRRICLYPNLA